mgnify:CR=1 FL=1
MSGYAIAAARDEFLVKFKYWLVVGGMIILNACGITTNLSTCPGVRPIDAAASFCPLVTPIIPALTHSAIKVAVYKDKASANAINSGIMAIKSNSLAKLIPMVKNKNVAKEFLLTDIVELANNDKIKVKALLLKDSSEVLGANNLQELHDLERAYQRSLAESLIRSGVKVADSSRLDVRGEIEVGRDSFIDVNSVFEGTNTSATYIDVSGTTNSSGTLISGGNFLRADAADTTTGALTIDSDSGLIVGDAQELTISVSSNNVTVAQTSQDKNLSFTINDGGVTKTPLAFTGSTGAIALTGDVTITGNLNISGEYNSTSSNISTYDDAFIKTNTGNSEADSCLLYTSDAADE